MRTLDEIYYKLDQLVPAPVEKTNQPESYATGDDGDLQKGVLWSSPRFTDNSDGTVTDNLTGLVWLKNANRFGIRIWLDALSDCNSLADDGVHLTDASQVGDWYLPNINELISLIHWGYHSPSVSNTTGNGRWSQGNPFSNVRSTFYWSSTSGAYYTERAWLVDFHHGDVLDAARTVNLYVWCVRGG
jgi:hypothetical protein